MNKHIEIPQIETQSNLDGYNTLPIGEFGARKKIHLHLQEESLSLVAFFEVLSILRNFDLFILVESASLRTKVINGLITKSRSRVYVNQVNSIIDVYRSILAGTYGDDEEIVLINDVSRLSRNILDQYDTIFLSLRSNFPHRAPSLSADLIEGKNLIPLLRAYFGERIAEEVRLMFESHNAPLCTLITSVYKSDQYIRTFIDNIRCLDEFDKLDHSYFFSKLSDLEIESLLVNFQEGCNQIYFWNHEDPGLYAFWNKGIRSASSEFISNANVDDLRDPNHTKCLLDFLLEHTEYSFAASALNAFSDYHCQLPKLRSKSPWYVDQGGEIKFEMLGKLKKVRRQTFRLEPHNLPHCMPVWRKKLHETHGYFDEQSYGTYADWAFWLKATFAGEVGYLVPEPLGYYYVNLESHNRRGHQLETLHDRIESEYLPHFIEKAKPKTRKPKACVNKDSTRGRKKLDLMGLEHAYGTHRNSFNRLIESLLPLNTGAGGVKFVPFIERYFVWGDHDGEARSPNPMPIKGDWVGILHVPFYSPNWFIPEIHPEQIFKTELWRQSFESCRGIITLSEDLKADLTNKMPNTPALSLKHPTEINGVRHFDFDLYRNNPRVIQVGEWLRDLQAIYRLKVSNHEKILLQKHDTKKLIEQQKRLFGDQTDSSVKMLRQVSNQKYDQLLSSAVAFCWLYATAANNLVIECIARCTPVVINPLPSVVEYLGEQYPLYMESIEEGAKKLEDPNLIKNAHEYLVKNEELRNALTYERFLNEFERSDFYSSL